MEKAQRELPPKVNQLLAKRPSRLRVLGQFAIWRLRYRLSKFELRGSEGKIDIFAQVHPTITLAPGWTFKDYDVFKVIDNIGGELLAQARAASPTAPRNDQGQVDFTQRTHAAEPAAHLQPMSTWTEKGAAPPPESQHIVGHTVSGQPIGYRHEQLWQQPPTGRIRPLEEGGGSNYSFIPGRLEGMNAGDALGKLVRNDPVPDMTDKQRDTLGELYGLWMGGKEASHPNGSYGHQRDLTYSYMIGQMMEPTTCPWPTQSSCIRQEREGSSLVLGVSPSKWSRTDLFLPWKSGPRSNGR